MKMLIFKMQRQSQTVKNPNPYIQLEERSIVVHNTPFFINKIGLKFYYYYLCYT